MKQTKRIVVYIAVLLAVSAAQNANSKGAVLVSDQRLKQLLPATVFIDGENVPTQERNAVLVQFPNGKVLLASLIDTAGYSSAYQEKYAGVLLSQTGFTVGAKSLDAGAYAIGQKKNADSVTIYVYNLGGEKVAEVPTERQENLRPLKPLQVIVAADGTARLYLGPYYVPVAGR
ncbi:MAG: hypothetical protein DMG61_03170 [Acidobacteria bacterium]|nr:MAG: hypothetical protein DMG60_20200 [Acidobacteriota bacterium]PYY17072.1 MAG: hypothetical protein DMG61_03170 [Acidobacteriota bacterium]